MTKDETIFSLNPIMTVMGEVTKEIRISTDDWLKLYALVNYHEVPPDYVKVTRFQISNIKVL